MHTNCKTSKVSNTNFLLARYNRYLNRTTINSSLVLIRQNELFHKAWSPWQARWTTYTAVPADHFRVDFAPMKIYYPKAETRESDSIQLFIKLSTKYGSTNPGVSMWWLNANTEDFASFSSKSKEFNFAQQCATYICDHRLYPQRHTREKPQVLVRKYWFVMLWPRLAPRSY